jgi:hypothetical protein
MSSTMGIIGLGWLGKALKIKFDSQFLIWGTHRVSDKLSTKDYSFDFFAPKPLPSADIVILNTPPLLRLSPKDYVSIVKNFKTKHLVFISSTSVFGTNQGLVTEETTPQPDTESGQWLVEVENELRSFSVSIIRPGGLIGGSRHPIYFLAGKTLEFSSSPVNLIHREDLMNIISLSLEKKTCLLHAISPYHPSREEYYLSWAKKLGLSLPLPIVKEPKSKEVRSLYLDELYAHWICKNLDWL